MTTRKHTPTKKSRSHAGKHVQKRRTAPKKRTNRVYLDRIKTLL